MGFGGVDGWVVWCVCEGVDGFGVGIGVDECVVRWRVNRNVW